MRFDKVIAKIIRVQFFCLTVYFYSYMYICVHYDNSSNYMYEISKMASK